MIAMPTSIDNLVGQKVVVTTKRVGNQRVTQRAGEIAAIDRKGWLYLRDTRKDPAMTVSGTITLCGLAEGITEIVASDGKAIYANPVVAKAYDQAEMLPRESLPALREEGTFYD